MEKLRKLLLEDSSYSGSDFNLTEDEANQVLALSLQLIPEYLVYKGLSKLNKDAKLPLLKSYIARTPSLTLEMEMYLILIMNEVFTKIEDNDFFALIALQESYNVIKIKPKEDILKEFEYIKNLPRLDTNVLFNNSSPKIKELQGILKDFGISDASKENIPKIIRVVKSLIKPEDTFDDKILIVQFLDFTVNMYKKTEELNKVKERLENLPEGGKIGISGLADIIDLIANSDANISLKGLEDPNLEQEDEEDEDD